jgi:hypothetical protein
MKTVRKLLGNAGASPAVWCASRDTIRVYARHTDIRPVVDFWRGAKIAGEAARAPHHNRLTNDNKLL